MLAACDFIFIAFWASSPREPMSVLPGFPYPRRWVDRRQVFLNSNVQSQWGEGGDGVGGCFFGASRVHGEKY